MHSSADALVVHSWRSFDQWLLSHWRFFAVLSASSSAGCYLTYQRSSPGAVDRADDIPSLWQVQRGSRQLRVTVPQIQAHHSVFLLLSRSLHACAAGGSLHTGATVTALSAGYISGSLPTGRLPSSYRRLTRRPPKAALLLKVEVIPKSPKNTKHDYLPSIPSKVQKPSINDPLV